MRYFVLIARLLVGCVFIYASIHKIFDPASFAADIRNYMIIPAAYSNLTALILPWIELGAGVFLVIGVQIRASALLTTAMLAVFMSALVYALAIGLDIDCGCFSSAAKSQSRIGFLNVVRDFSLLGISAFVLFVGRDDFGISSLISRMRAK